MSINITWNMTCVVLHHLAISNDFGVSIQINDSFSYLVKVSRLWSSCQFNYNHVYLFLSHFSHK